MQVPLKASSRRGSRAGRWRPALFTANANRLGRLLERPFLAQRPRLALARNAARVTLLPNRGGSTCSRRDVPFSGARTESDGRSQPIGNVRRSFCGNLEASMNKRDETIREKLLERLSAVDVDARNLAIEVATGSVIVRGSVPTEQQRTRTIEALAGAHSIEVLVRPAASVDGDDGRGR
jgi:hypothetical protein